MNESNNQNVDASAPWIEKYRPKKISDISHQDVVKRTLANIVQTHNMPHLLFFGPPGTGKTTSILALARELFGEDWKKRTRELNASDDRGIVAVREKVKSFAEQVPAQIRPRSDGIQPPNFKIIILDEADMMTNDAQSCLRRVMEDYCHHTRFVLICNYVTNIISPIRSRCASYRFEPIAEGAQIDRLKMIGQSEGFNLSDEAIQRLVSRSGGDMRLAITTLYTIHCCGSTDVKTSTDIDLMIGYPEPGIVDRILSLVTNDDTSQINELVDEIVADGWDLELLLKSLSERLMESSTYSCVQKAIISQVLASTQVSLMNGVREYTALMTVVLEMHNVRALKA